MDLICCEKRVDVSACCVETLTVKDKVSVSWFGLFMDDISRSFINDFKGFYHGCEKTFLREDEYEEGVLKFREQFGRKWCGEFIAQQESDSLLCSGERTRLGDQELRGYLSAI